MMEGLMLLEIDVDISIHGHNGTSIKIFFGHKARQSIDRSVCHSIPKRQMMYYVGQVRGLWVQVMMDRASFNQKVAGDSIDEQ